MLLLRIGFLGYLVGLIGVVDFTAALSTLSLLLSCLLILLVLPICSYWRATTYNRPGRSDSGGYFGWTLWQEWLNCTLFVSLFVLGTLTFTDDGSLRP